MVVETYKIRVNAHGAGKESRTPNALALGPKPSPYANSGIPAYTTFRPGEVVVTRLQSET